MANFLYHEPCDNCGSKDNRAVYDDDSKWCFGCSTYTPGTARGRLFFETRTKDVPRIPRDLQEDLPADCRNWLMKYRLINFHQWRWSPMQRLLVWKDDNSDFAIGRNFGNPNLPKYMNFGGQKPNLIFGVVDRDKPLYLVEDLISAMVIGGRGSQALPLFGTSVRKDTIDFLKRHRYTKLVLWLDRDKAQEAVKTVVQLRNYFTNVSLMVTEKDPKEF